MTHYQVLLATAVYIQYVLVNSEKRKQCTVPQSTNTLQGFINKTIRCNTYFQSISKRMSLYTDADYLGCFETFEEKFSFYNLYNSNELTLEDCILKCQSYNILYAGVRNGNQCYCTPNNAHIKQVEERKCSKECPTDFRFYCGGKKAMQIYKTHVYGTGIFLKAKVTYLGCYVTHWTPFLSGNKTSVDKMTIELCLETCNNLNSYYAGLLKRFYCLCGNNTIKTNPTSDKHCSLRCAGNLKQHCGGFHHIQVYRTKIEKPTRIPVWDRNTTYLGCFRKNKDNTFLVIKYFSAMTLEWCLNRCRESGIQYCAIQGRQCFATAESPKHHKKLSSHCDQRCPGNEMQYCGSQPSDSLTFLQVYWIKTPNQFYSPNGTFVGCFEGRIGALQQMKKILKSRFVSIDICLKACYFRGFQFAALETGIFCVCGQVYDNLIKVPDTDCNFTCPANGHQMCGGRRRLQIHSVHIYPGRFTTYGFYLGCYRATNMRLNQIGIVNENMTLNMCLLYCWKSGFAYAAVEKGIKCQCGNHWYYYAIKSDNSKCSIKCLLENNDYCGGVGRFQVYHVEYILKKIFGRSAISIPTDLTWI
ncbi:uncharacterized protein LOC106878286 [Octopus bimaculoides]|uniref:WSC domain-containing protein n=1 Tax=Octopus bimaculoides TaxID=37653 RepID=A0A0L8G9U9_OCTBM|nr:uncharacterized protein LOC106878286 [Octopus bimaculoides]|eukprot:XP_014782949.1 PREDICTED: uncharacterized protein LOC106878286 [Octopus bimaculoides]